MNHHLLYIHNTTSEAVCVVVPASAVGMEAGLNSLSLQSAQTGTYVTITLQCARVLPTLSFKIDPELTEVKTGLMMVPWRHVGHVDKETLVQSLSIVSQEKK